MNLEIFVENLCPSVFAAVNSLDRIWRNVIVLKSAYVVIRTPSILIPAQLLICGLRPHCAEVDLAAVVSGPIVARRLKAISRPLRTCIDLREHAKWSVVVALSNLDCGGRGEDKAACE